MDGLQKALALTCSLFLFTSIATADSEIYRWVDKDGNVHYSDCPPPEEEECEPETVAIAPGPSAEDVAKAQARLDAMLEERDIRAAELAEEKREAVQRREEEKAVSIQRKRDCIYARQNLHTLQRRLPVYRLDERGEHVYVDDEQRALEIERMELLIAENCD